MFDCMSMLIEETLPLLCLLKRDLLVILKKVDVRANVGRRWVAFIKVESNSEWSDHVMLLTTLVECSKRHLRRLASRSQVVIGRVRFGQHADCNVHSEFDVQLLSDHFLALQAFRVRLTTKFLWKDSSLRLLLCRADIRTNRESRLS